MDYLRKPLSREQFKKYLFDDFKQRREIDKIVLHYLWKRKENYFWGIKSLIGLDEYYKKQDRTFAFHLCVKDDDIWIAKDLNEKPDQSGDAKINDWAIALECDAVIGHRPPNKKTWKTYLFVISMLMKRFTLNPNHLFLHKEFHEGDTCPDFTKEFLLKELNGEKHEK